MLNALFLNAVILIAFISLGTQAFREKPLTLYKNMPVKIVSGILTGVLGCLLMRYSITVRSNVLLDLRNISIIISSVYFGLIASFFAGAVIGVFRILFFGVTTSSVIALFSSLIIGIGCGLICKNTMSLKRKWTYSVIYSLSMGSIGFIFSIKIITTLINVLIYYWAATILTSLLVCFYIQYLDESGNLYRRYRDELKKDFLTGLNNVRQFDVIFNELIGNLKVNRNGILSLLYIDIDFFKKVNDTHGHSIGDTVLKEFSGILTSACGNKDLIFRNGGEEFSIILLNSSSNAAVELAEKIRFLVQAHSFRLDDGKEFGITASIGISSYPDTTTDIDALLEEADKALYTAKLTGRNRVVMSEQKLSARI